MEELKNLKEICSAATNRFNKYDNRDFIMPLFFKEQVKEINSSIITYNDYSAVIETRGNHNGELKIFMPNQWFYIASYFTDLYNELQKYKIESLKVVSKERLKNLNGSTLTDNEMSKLNALQLSDDSKSYLVKFITDYSWWNGAKTIDRGDFYVSPILNCARLVNASQSYIADLCAFLADKKELINAIISCEEDAITNRSDKTDMSYQKIYYGAPGTGKSHKIKEQLEGVAKENIFRTTFHPDSDYSTFVGAYKPTRSKKPLYGLNGGLTVRLNDGEDLNEEIITYKFIPQVFLNAYMRAYSTTDNVYLVIEEINRGNCAQIFGDLFQLLDRDVSGVSEYTIKADADLKAFLEEELGADSDAIKDGELCLPSNLHIYATMNTSDQSLFPIDSAFKRRWDWEYEPIKYKNIDWVIDIKGEKFSWVSFQREINKRIFAANSSEDKMLGDYFVNPHDGIITEKILLNKILFYLWNDVCKDGEGDIFKISETEDVSFSDLHGEGGAEKLIMMMEYLGISELYDEENGDMTSTGNNQRKRPKYSVNGSNERFSTPKAVQYIIENYAKQNEYISTEEMIGLWNEISERKNCLIASWSPSPNDNQPFAEKRRVEIKWGNKSAWLVTGWTEELFQIFIHNVKAKLGIVIEKVE